MTRALARTHIYSSSLIRFLSDLDLVEHMEPASDFAERLGGWLDFRNAITLHAVLGSPLPAPTTLAMARKSVAVASLDQTLSNLRARLTQSILGGKADRRANARHRLPEPSYEPGIKPSVAYEPYRRYCLALQRDMELSIRPVRAQVRQSLAQTSAEHRKLAALDEAMESILSERESHGLGKVPVLLEKRFKRLLKQHQQTLADTQQEDSQFLWAANDGWLTRFCQELQTALLTELDVRLQPIQGLLEALHQKNT